MEYNHMEELGFSEDKQVMCTASGFLASGNPMRRMCDRFIRNGGRLYDILMAYDNILSFGLNREDRRSGDSFRTLVPLLKAAGVTDSSVHGFFVNDMRLTSGSEAIHHLNKMMTTAIVSESYEHHAAVLCDSLRIPVDSVFCMNVSFDELDMERNDAKRFREFAMNISKMDVPKVSSKGDTEYIDQKDQMILDTVDGIIEKMNETDFMYQMEQIKPVGGNEKAFALMDMRRRTEVDLESTAYIGNNGTDYPSMDIVRDNDGLALSFNGDEYAVKGSNVAVMAPNSIIAALIVSEFYANGTEGVYSMIDSWDRDKLLKRGCSDRHLTDAMLRAFPSKLPSAVIVDDDNVDDVIKESERYRRKLGI
jgi:predicted HAD superfamily phosphohydrolase